MTDVAVDPQRLTQAQRATDPRERLAEFAAYLRDHGFALGYAEVELMTQAAAALPLAQWPRTEALWRSIASGSHAQWLKYAELHRAFWFPHSVKGSTRSSGVTRRARTLPELVEQLHSEQGDSQPGKNSAPRGAQQEAQGEGEDSSAPPQAQGGASRTEALVDRDFKDWLPQDIDRFDALVEDFRRRLRTQLLRRWQPHQSSGTIHLRRSLRAALSTGGELVKLHHVRRQRRQPRVALLVDVSRSMEVHAQFYLRLARAFVEVMDARAFVFHTRLAEVTPLMKQSNRRVQEKINAVTFGFGGGTRIGSCLQTALHQHMGRGCAQPLGHGDVFMVFSDGYDTDEPVLLAQVLGEVRARGARVCWLHPTAQIPASAAMDIARQHVNRFLPAHNLASLSRLHEILK
ncbi:MAG: VWA domain-containing protein [Burkholderiaceae bacterium]